MYTYLMEKITLQEIFDFADKLENLDSKTITKCLIEWIGNALKE